MQGAQYFDVEESCNLIQWFWEIIESFDQDLRVKFLFFVTGTTKIPPSGLQKPIQIQRIYDLNRLPVAHTCFHRLDLPNYKTKEELSSKINYSITEG